MRVSFWRDNGMKFRATLALIALNLAVFVLEILQPRESILSALKLIFLACKFYTSSDEYGRFMVVWFAN